MIPSFKEILKILCLVDLNRRHRQYDGAFLRLQVQRFKATLIGKNAGVSTFPQPWVIPKSAVLLLYPLYHVGRPRQLAAKLTVISLHLSIILLHCTVLTVGL